MRAKVTLALWGVVCIGTMGCQCKKSPEDVTELVKQATVFVRTTEAAGSSFVISNEGDDQYLLTNAHVVEGVGVGETVEVTYFAGSPSEWTGKATVVCTDGYRDLAVLRASAPAKRPTPLKGNPDAKELMPVIIAGFPFGDRLSLDAKAAAVSLSRASVSALRTTALGEVELLQLDNNINPGNSGGPVVDDQGRVVGISVAALRGAGIGFVIPWAHADALLEGRGFEPKITVPSDCEGSCSARVEVTVVDPFRKTKRVELRLVEADDGFLREAHTSPKAEGEILATAARPPSGANTIVTSANVQPKKRYFLQVGFEGGSMVYRPPFELRPTEAKQEAQPSPPVVARPAPAPAPVPAPNPPTPRAQDYPPPPPPAGGERKACWHVTQIQEVGTRIDGELMLVRRGDIADGTAQFVGHPLAMVTASFNGTQARLLLRYPNGMVGAYEASLDARTGNFFDGIAGANTGASASWSATITDCAR